MSSGPLTVVETPQFPRQADAVWTEAERVEFVDFIARNPETRDVIPETGGVVRYAGEDGEWANEAALG
jgi:hypothetical protein